MNLKQEILDRMKHFYGQTDGSFKWPNSAEGDLLRMVHQHLTQKQSRPRTTGRFGTREQLEERVRWYYRNTNMNMSEIAKNCKISVTTVSNILKV